MMGNVFAFLRLSRPVFLGGGFVLYALGALVAYHQGIALDWRLYLVGQVAVTSIQLMTHYLNDYWDVDSDRLNNHRTLFSGGSGILASGELPRRVALWAALVCLAVGLAAILVLALAYRPGWVPLTVAAFMVAGAWSYSSPPLALESSGFGELATALIVSFLVPSLGFSLQLGTLDWMLVLASLPLVALNWAMVVAFHFPDFEADRGANKRTLLVRLGHGPAARLHALAVLGAYALLLASPALSPFGRPHPAPGRRRGGDGHQDGPGPVGRLRLADLYGRLPVRPHGPPGGRRVPLEPPTGSPDVVHTPGTQRRDYNGRVGGDGHLHWHRLVD